MPTYDPTTWVDAPDPNNPPAGAVPVDAANLNKLEQGVAAASAAGLPVGGASGQVLAKASNADYDAAWVTDSGGGGASSAAALRWYDTKDYGAVSNLARAADTSVTAGNATVPGTAWAGAADVGKLIRIQAAGALLYSGTDGAMSSSPISTKNRFTSAGSSFDSRVIGRWLVIDGQFKARIVGVESATQLRLATPAGSTFSGATWRIAEDHYTTIASSVSGTSATLAVAPITSVTNAIIWYGTDDAPAIQAAVTDAELATNQGGNGNVVYHFGASMIGTAIYLQKPTQLIGAGSRGYSELEGHGRTRLMLGAPRIRGIVGGGPDTGMGVNGAMTAGSAVLTDPDANFQAGDVGKHILVYEAGTPTGSEKVFLNTTILSRQSATQVTLAANAGSTVTAAIYTYATNAGYGGGLVGPSVKNVHIEGGPGQLAGLHLMNCSESLIEEVCCSTFGSGVGQFMDGGPSSGFSNQSEFRSCFANNNRIGFKHERGTIMFTGNCFVDGNDNRVDCSMPELMTLGVDGNGIDVVGYIKIQAVGTGFRSVGRGGGCQATSLDLGFENCSVAMDLASDGTGGKHHRVGYSSIGNSNAGGGHGLRLRSGARATLERGFTLDNDINMFDLVDPSAQLAVLGEYVQKIGAVSDSDFANVPYDGAEGVDTSTGNLYKRIAGSWQVVSGSSGTAEPKAVTLGVGGTITATMTDTADFPVAAPFAMTLQRMKVTAKSAPSGSMTVQLRKSTDGGTTYADVTGFVVTFTAGSNLAIVDPADVAAAEGDMLNFSVATGSGANLLVEVVGIAA